MSASYKEDHNNVELCSLLSRLSELGKSQKDVAEVLEISGPHLSYIKNGTRRAAARHNRTLSRFVSKLEKERILQSGRVRERIGAPIFSINHEDLGVRSSGEAVSLFRDLLWAEALRDKASTTQARVTLNINVADGGVDASFAESESENKLLRSAPTRFQVKTGEFKPWHPSIIDAELFNGKERCLESLGSEVRSTLEEGGRYVLVCFGIDLNETQGKKALKNLRAAFSECGFPKADVDVWGQSELVGLFEQFPSLCLRLKGMFQHGFRIHQSWAQDEDMRPIVHHGPETQQLITELREKLRSGEVKHLRFVGEPGVGKTRLALELTKADDLSPVTIYIKDAGTITRSSFLNELIQFDAHQFVLLVVDECSKKDSAELWNMIKSNANRIRILTIDNSPDNSTGEGYQVEEIQKVHNEQIIMILEDYDLGKIDAQRWSRFCQGCPRVAHVLGDNLRMNPSELLKSPATTDVWDRFITGQDDSDPDRVQNRKLVLRYVALFEMFGFQSPVEDEAKFIADLAGIPWQQFQDTISDLKGRKIIQGVRTLYITPRLLHVYLNHEFWQVHGGSFDITDTMERLSPHMRHWFIKMLKYAHDSRPALEAIKRLLGPRGLFHQSPLENNQEHGSLIMSLAEAAPNETLRCLERVFSGFTLDELKALTEPRQRIVWALERIAVWKDSFEGAVMLLLRLAEAENANNSNNATGTFIQLFSLRPGIAATQADQHQRLSVLKEVLDSPSSETRQLGLAACKSALDTYGHCRTMGPEHQGLRATIPFWMPSTYGELWDAYRCVWELVVEKYEAWTGEDRTAALEVLLSGASHLLQIEALAPQALETLSRLLDDVDVMPCGMINLIQYQLKYCEESHTPETRLQLQMLEQKLEGTNFSSRLRRYVRYPSDYDTYRQEPGQKSLETWLEELSQDANENHELLLKELPWLVTEESNAIYHFAARIGKLDVERTHLPEILSECESQTNSKILYLTGYLAAVFNHDPSEWEEIVLGLADAPEYRSQFSNIVIESGMTNKTVLKVIELCRKGHQDIALLERWWFSWRLSSLPIEIMNQLISLQLEMENGKLWANAVSMFHHYFCDKDANRTLPEELTYELLTHEAMSEHRTTTSAYYYWSKIAVRFLEVYPARIWDFFERILTLTLKESMLLNELCHTEEDVITSILADDPVLAFERIQSVLEQNKLWECFGIQSWLDEGGIRLYGDRRPGPITHIPSSVLFDWVDQDREQRASWIAMTLPKTFDQSPAGRLTSDFTAKYGRAERVASSLNAHFGRRSWCGNQSDFYRTLRQEANEWNQHETNHTVRSWLQNYIEDLSGSIDQAEMEEERDLWSSY